NDAHERDFVFDLNTNELAPEHRSLKRDLSARIAEKSAMALYSALNGEAEDCSVLQTIDRDERWKYFDIFSDKPIDVKNVTIYRNNVRQSFISKFKRHATEDVTICAIATKTNTPEFRKNSLSPSIRQTFLGELTRSELHRSKAAV